MAATSSAARRRHVAFARHAIGAKVRVLRRPPEGARTGFGGWARRVADAIPVRAHQAIRMSPRLTRFSPPSGWRQKTQSAQRAPIDSGAAAIPLSRCASISIFLATGSRAWKFRRGSSRSQTASSFITSGEPDETPPDVRTTPIAELPDDALLFLLSSRYCDSDKLADFAWSRFGKLSGGTWCVRAISDFVHAKIRFNYADARSTRCASDSMQEGIGVCRDFAHLAIALCRCINIPARYCTGYLGDIGVPADVNPGDFSAWGEVFLDGRWYTIDARHNHPRIGRIVMGRGRDAADVAMSTALASPTSCALSW